MDSFTNDLANSSIKQKEQLQMYLSDALSSDTQDVVEPQVTQSPSLDKEECTPQITSSPDVVPQDTNSPTILQNDTPHVTEAPVTNEEHIPQITESPSKPTSSPSEEEKKNSTNYILPFKAIHTFITSMNEEFGNKNKPLRLYARLIEQTTFSHELPIKKHVQAFTSFCTNNRDAIYSKKYELLKQSKISYSERVFLDIRDIFKLADKDQKAVMWQHILTISALVDSAGRAKQILKETNSNTKETNFLTDIIEKVEKNVNIDNVSNPFEAIGQIMSSGVFTELIGSMNEQVNSGQLDMSKMLNAVQDMVGTITKEQPEMGQMINGLMSSMGNLPNLENLGNLPKKN
jgi:hypothetical protein